MVILGVCPMGQLRDGRFVQRGNFYFVDKSFSTGCLKPIFCYHDSQVIVAYFFLYICANPYLVSFMIISFASSKGGVGKSTCCAAIGAALALQGDGEDERVLILDLDQNRTLARWSQKIDIEGLEIKAVDRDDFTSTFRKAVASGQYGAILIDLAGAREATVLKAIARSDLVIIPAQASEPDLREALVVVSDIRDVEEERAGKIPYRLLLTKVYPLRTRVTEFIYKELVRHGLPTFRTSLVERVAYREMFLTGKPPSLSQPDSGAGAEIAALVDEIRQVLDIERAEIEPQLENAG